MKLKAVHLFLILLGVLLISHSLGRIVEGFSGSKTNEKRENNGNNGNKLEKKTKKDFNRLMTDFEKLNTFDTTDKYNNKNPDNKKKHKKETDDNSDIYDYTNKNSNDINNSNSNSNSNFNDNMDITNSDYYIGPAGDTVLTGPSSGSTYHKKANSNKLDNHTPLGIPRTQIPSGDEHLYILKSEVIPPVCPACPSIIACPNKNKDTPPPCPPCARCPEPAFDCKKVPNYNRNNSQYLPIPVLSDFSQFGM